ncbi:hypothetical protein [Enterococcus italicus]|uniref:hypothetical protein n=1 Tax=Enterococcus italicus TaxID=246144 RepID=UPI003FA2716A
MYNNFYLNSLNNLVDELKLLIETNESISITDLDNLELGILEAELKVYKNMLIKILTILVEGGRES